MVATASGCFARLPAVHSGLNSQASPGCDAHRSAAVFGVDIGKEKVLPARGLHLHRIDAREELGDPLRLFRGEFEHHLSHGTCPLIAKKN